MQGDLKPPKHVQDIDNLSYMVNIQGIEIMPFSSKKEKARFHILIKFKSKSVNKQEFKTRSFEIIDSTQSHYSPINFVFDCDPQRCRLTDQITLYVKKLTIAGNKTHGKCTLTLEELLKKKQGDKITIYSKIKKKKLKSDGKENKVEDQNIQYIGDNKFKVLVGNLDVWFLNCIKLKDKELENLKMKINEKEYESMSDHTSGEDEGENTEDEDVEDLGEKEKDETDNGKKGKQKDVNGEDGKRKKKKKSNIKGSGEGNLNVIRIIKDITKVVDNKHINKQHSKKKKKTNNTDQDAESIQKDQRVARFEELYGNMEEQLNKILELNKGIVPSLGVMFVDVSSLGEKLSLKYKKGNKKFHKNVFYVDKFQAVGFKNLIKNLLIEYDQKVMKKKKRKKPLKVVLFGDDAFVNRFVYHVVGVNEKYMDELVFYVIPTPEGITDNEGAEKSIGEEVKEEKPKDKKKKGPIQWSKQFFSRRISKNLIKNSKRYASFFHKKEILDLLSNDKIQEINHRIEIYCKSGNSEILKIPLSQMTVVLKKKTMKKKDDQENYNNNIFLPFISHVAYEAEQVSEKKSNVSVKVDYFLVGKTNTKESKSKGSLFKKKLNVNSIFVNTTTAGDDSKPKTKSMDIQLVQRKQNGDRVLNVNNLSKLMIEISRNEKRNTLFVDGWKVNLPVHKFSLSICWPNELYFCLATLKPEKLKKKERERIMDHADLSEEDDTTMDFSEKLEEKNYTYEYVTVDD